jgi:hypothetical protein
LSVISPRLSGTNISASPTRRELLFSRHYDSKRAIIVHPGRGSLHHERSLKNTNRDSVDISDPISPQSNNLNARCQDALGLPRKR